MKKRRPISDSMKLALVRQHNPWVACDYKLSDDCKGVWLSFVNAQYDHHLALIDGGAHSVENLRYICVPCHKIKSAREHIANCKAKRLRAGPKKSKNPMPKTHQKLQAHVDGWGKNWKAKLEAQK